MATKDESVPKEDIENPVFTYDFDPSDLKEENKLLKATVSQLRNEISRYKTPALMAADVVDLVNDKALIQVANGNRFLVEISKNVKLKPGESVLLEQKNLTVVDKLFNNGKHNVERFVLIEKPQTSWKDIGGLDEQINEIHEVVELPMKNPHVFKKIGIEPPKGILLYGPPGTGKTLLAKAVAASTNSTFIEIVGSELVQKFIGEGAKLVKEVFELARKKAPSVVFIDEMDALAAKRIEIGTSGEREVQRTFMQLLAEIDGFEPLGNVKIIGCTNRKDILDPAILRPGRLDRQIEVPHPNEDGIKEIFKIHTKNMNISKVETDKVHKKLKGLSGAEVKAVCTEAGYFALRSKRTKITDKDFHAAVRKIKKDEQESNFLEMFG